jgi:hypothetical protein
MATKPRSLVIKSWHMYIFAIASLMLLAQTQANAAQASSSVDVTVHFSSVGLGGPVKVIIKGDSSVCHESE